MKHKNKIIIFSLLGLVIITASLLGYSAYKKNKVKSNNADKNTRKINVTLNTQS